MSEVLYLAEKLSVILGEKDLKSNHIEVWTIIDEIEFEFIFDAFHVEAEQIALQNLKEKVINLLNDHDLVTYGARKEAVVMAAYFLKNVIMRRVSMQI